MAFGDMGNYYRAHADLLRAQANDIAGNRSLQDQQLNNADANAYAMRNLQNAQAFAATQGAKTQAMAGQANADVARSTIPDNLAKTGLTQAQTGLFGQQARYTGLQGDWQQHLNSPLDFNAMSNSDPLNTFQMQSYDPTMQRLRRLGGMPLAGFSAYAEGTTDAGGKAPKGQARAAARQELGPDMVPAMLSPGEAVLNREAAEHIGRGVIAHLNEIGLAKAAMKAQTDGQPMTPGDPQTPPMHQGGGPQQMPFPVPGHADGATTIWPGYAGGLTDAQVVVNAQGRNGGNIVGLGGGIFDYLSNVGSTAGQIPGGQSGYLNPRVVDHGSNLAPAGGGFQAAPTGSAFQPAMAPQGFQAYATGGMVQPTGGSGGVQDKRPAKGKSTVKSPVMNVGSNDDGSGRQPPGVGRHLPTQPYQQYAEGTEKAKTPTGKMKGEHYMPSSPIQNFAAGVEEVRPVSAMFPHADAMAGRGMVTPQKHAKGTAKVKGGGKSAVMAPAPAPQSPGALPPGITSMPVTSMPAMPGSGLPTQYGGGQ